MLVQTKICSRNNQEYQGVELNSNRMNKTLLLTDIPPCKDYTAGLVLDSLCRFFDPGEIACFTILNKKLKAELSPDLDWIPIEYCSRPNENGGSIYSGTLSVASSLVYELYNELIAIPKIVDKAVSFGKQLGTEKVWCILQGQTMIHVARAVADGIGCPLLVQVWDPLEWWLRAHKVNKLSSARLVRKFADIMKNCDGCFAASIYMAEHFTEKYGVSTVDFTPSLDIEMAYPPAKGIHSENEVVFAMAGQLYASDEWTLFISALNLRGWMISGRNIRIILLGNHEYLKIPEWATGRVERTGWLSQSDTLAMCNRADFLYCPYWFSMVYENEARLSFPAKLTTYLASGRPVFFHGPRYASPARFLEKNEAGYICDSNLEENICTAIEQAISDAAGYARMSRNGSVAFKQYMTTGILKSKFNKFMATHT